MIKKVTLEIYSLLKDIILFSSYSHKVPISKIFNKLPYQNLRILVDSFLTTKYQNKILKNISNDKKPFFKLGNQDGFFLNLNFLSDEKIEKLKSICDLLLENYKQHNIRIDDGGNLDKNSDSFSKYYYIPNIKGKLTSQVRNFYEILFDNDNLIHQLQFLAGINFKKSEISVHISRVKGKLLSDDWHSDCFSHTAKAFLYLHTIDKNNSPFCFLKRSHANKSLKILNQKENSKNVFKSNKDKSKDGDDIWNKLKDSEYQKEIFKNSEPIECSYPKGTLITCDTSGFHKKGFSDGTKERYMIGFVSKRGTMLEKLKSAFI